MDSFKIAEFFPDRNGHGPKLERSILFASQRTATPPLFRTQHPTPSPCKIAFDVQR
jgi:hypothetical protein